MKNSKLVYQINNEYGLFSSFKEDIKYLYIGLGTDSFNIPLIYINKPFDNIIYKLNNPKLYSSGIIEYEIYNSLKLNENFGANAYYKLVNYFVENHNFIIDDFNVSLSSYLYKIIKNLIFA